MVGTKLSLVEKWPKFLQKLSPGWLRLVQYAFALPVILVQVFALWVGEIDKGFSLPDLDRRGPIQQRRTVRFVSEN